MEVNLRGQVFSLTAKNEKAIKGTPLYAQLTADNIEHDGHGRPVVNCDPAVFSLAVHYLSTSQFGWTPGVSLPKGTLRELASAANTLQMPALKDAVILEEVAQLSPGQPLYDQFDALVDLIRLGRLDDSVDAFFKNVCARPSGSDEELTDEFAKYAKRRKGDWAANYFAALHMFELGCGGHPEKFLRRAAGLDADGAACVAALMSAFLALRGEPQAAFDVAEQALVQHPQNWELHYRAAVASALMPGETHRALRVGACEDKTFESHLSAARTLVPSHYRWAPLALEAWASLTDGHYAAAERVFTQAMQAAPKGVRWSLAEALREAQDKQVDPTGKPRDFTSWRFPVLTIAFAYTRWVDADRSDAGSVIDSESASCSDVDAASMSGSD